MKRPSRLRRWLRSPRFWWLVALSPVPVLLLLFAASVAWTALTGKTECSFWVTSLARSPEHYPDPPRFAIAREEMCEGPGLATTTVDYVVHLPRAGASPSRDTAVVVVEGNTIDFTPVPRWLSPNKLQITVPNDAVIPLQKSTYEGVEIEVKFDPDDPAARAEALRLQEARLKCGCSNPPGNK